MGGILRTCVAGPQSTPELLQALGYTSRTGNYKNALMRLVEQLHLVEMTIPDSPRSKKQKYRLTTKGKQYVQSAKAKY